MSLQTNVLDRARSQIGVKESPSGSNKQKYGSWYGMNGQPWCAIFVTWNTVLEGSEALKQGSRYAYVPYIEQDARAGKNGLKVVTSPQPGDIVTFDWDNDGVADHVGLVEKVLGGGSYQTIEGNTSTSNNSNGGQVMRRTRYSSEISMFVRYPDTGGGFLMGLNESQQDEVLHGARVMRGVSAYYDALEDADGDADVVEPDDVKQSNLMHNGWKFARNMFRTFDVAWGEGGSSKPDEAPTGVSLPTPSRPPVESANGTAHIVALIALVLAAAAGVSVVGLVIAVLVSVANGNTIGTNVGTALGTLLGAMVGVGAAFALGRRNGGHG